jgi:hypothetical protein
MTDRYDYTCDECGGEFVSERSQEEAHAECESNWGVRGDAPGMAIVCDDCYKKIMSTLVRAFVPLGVSRS